ncbi:MAG: LuxR family transcriptional regulator [Actinobacteria bacterium]|nr:LuxR family transcriptional regulator [Actinomycetota bacterium]
MLDSWPLTGRDEEIGFVTERIDRDDCHGVALVGAAGVGKTRLAREAAAGLSAHGWSVCHVVATAMGSAIPLSAFGQWVEVYDGSPLRLIRNVIRSLRAAADQDRLVVVVDDANLLDDMSALVVHHLVVERVASVIMTMRNGQRVPDVLTALWKDGHVQRLDLQALSRSESDELLCHALGLPPDEGCAYRMWRLTQGNVLFLRQLVEQEQRARRLVHRDGVCTWLGDHEASVSLVEVVEHQIGAMSDPVRDLLDLVAVGEPIDWQCLRTLVDKSVLEEAERRELITTSGEVVYAGHPMYSEVRLSQCGPMRLRRLRGLVASAMTCAAGPADTVRRGLLWLDSDLPADPTVLAAAASAASTLLNFDAAARLSSAAETSDTAARVGLAYNLVLSQRGDAAAGVIDRIDGDEVSESAFINDVVLRAANLLWTMRAPEESWRVIDDALETAGTPRRGQLLAFRANQLVLAARPGEVVEMMRTVDYGPLDGYGQSVRLCSETLALAEVGRIDAATTRAAMCASVLDSFEQGNFLAEALAEFHSFGLAVTGFVHEAAELAATHHKSCAAKPPSAKAMAAAILGAVELAAGDLRNAVRHLPSENAAEDPNMVLVNSFYRFQMLRAQALARLGQLEAADAAIATAEADWHPVYVLVELNGLMAKAWLAAARQRMSDARGYAEQAVQFTRAHGQLAREVHCLQTLVQFGDPTVAPRLAELAARVEGPRAPLAARYAAALASDDASKLELVSQAFEQLGDLLAAADAAGQAATAHRRAGRAGSAMTAAARAGRLAKAGGGATSPAIVAASVKIPFTQREHEIAILVSHGLSNRAIAQTVSLSVRTIEGHIYRASCKAGVTRRSELAEVMRDLGSRVADDGKSQVVTPG